MPDDLDLGTDDSDCIFDDPSTVDGAKVPDGDSGLLITKSVDPSLLKISREGSSLAIGFNEIEVTNELNIADYRDQVFSLLSEDKECSKLTFDVSNLKYLPSGMLGLLASVKKKVPTVEVLNPSADILESLRVTNLDTVVTTRNSNS